MIKSLSQLIVMRRRKRVLKYIPYYNYKLIEQIFTQMCRDNKLDVSMRTFKRDIDYLSQEGYIIKKLRRCGNTRKTVVIRNLT